MATLITPSTTTLRAALGQVNQIIFDREYIAVAAKPTDPKGPVFLELKYPDGKTRHIGIVHLVHLKGKEWGKEPFTEVAKTTQELADAILGRITLFFEAEARPFYTAGNGTIFYFNQTNLIINKNRTFTVNGNLVTYGDIPLRLTKIKSEGIVVFRQLENGDTELCDSLDQRKGQRILIDNKGRVYRA